jgi:hypothetical protein
MLENKNGPSLEGSYSIGQDIIGSGEKILSQLDKDSKLNSSDFSDKKIESLVN